MVYSIRDRLSKSAEAHVTIRRGKSDRANKYFLGCRIQSSPVLRNRIPPTVFMLPGPFSLEPWTNLPGPHITETERNGEGAEASADGKRCVGKLRMPIIFGGVVVSASRKGGQLPTRELSDETPRRRGNWRKIALSTAMRLSNSNFH
jgi:hypothetical protein